MRVPIQWGGGVNLNADPRAIRDDQVAKATNAFPSLEGLLDKREPVLAARVAISPSYSDGLLQPITMFVPDPVTGYDFIAHLILPGVAEYLYASNLDNDAAPLTTIVRAGDVTPLGPFSFTNYRGNVLAVGSDMEGFWQLVNKAGARQWIRASFEWAAGTVGTTAAQHQLVPVKPRVATSFQGRMVYANFGPGMENWMVWADADSRDHTNTTTAPLWARVGNDVLSDNGSHVELREIQGESIVAMREVMLAGMGAQMTPCLLVLTERSAVFITGEPAQTTDAAFSDALGYVASLQAHRNTYECGIAGMDAVVSTPYGTFWAARNEVWFMNDNTPNAIGMNIRPALEACPPSGRKYWAMAYANGVLFLSVVTQVTGSDANISTQHWRLDLRQGPPQDGMSARWWGPQDYENLGEWACPSSAAPALCHSIVTRRGLDEIDVVYSLCKSDTSTIPGLYLITFNQPGGAMDVPFISPREARHWALARDASTGDTISVGDTVQPTILATDGYIYVATVGGLTGLVEPVWPGLGGTVVDGDVTWKEVSGTSAILNRAIARYAKTVTHDPAILLNVECKDLNTGEPAREKSVTRADVTAYFALKARFGLPLRINGGGLMKQMGPVTFGLRQDGDAGAAMDETGGLTVDGNTSVVAKEYEARTLRPSSINGGRYTGISAEFAGAGVVRGRQIQPIMVDGSGFLIDDTNDYLTVGADDGSGALFTNFLGQAFIPHGYYANMNALLDAIVLALNAIPLNYGEATAGWGYTDCYAAGPYTITFTKTTDPGRSQYVNFTFSNQDYTVDDVVYHGARSGRLLSMLGFDTSNEYDTAVGAANDFDGVRVHLIGEKRLPDPRGSASTVIVAQQSVPYTQASPLSISSVALDVVVKSGLPFTAKSR